MIPYFVYYFFSLLLLFFDKKLIPIAYSIFWFFFIGFRDGIGTDYYSTLKSVERGFIDFQNIGDSFRGYMLVDLELVPKIISTILYYFDLEIKYYYVIVAFLSSLMIYLLLKKIKNKKLLLLFFVLMFSLNYPMNIVRMGFSMLIVIFGSNYYNSTKFKFIILACLSHYGTIPIILLKTIKKFNVKLILFILILIFILFYFLFDLVKLRWPTDDISGYKFKGYGLSLFLSTIILVITNYALIEKKFLTKDNIILIILTIATYAFNPFQRYMVFYTTVLVFSNIFLLDKKIISGSKLLIFLIYPFFCFIGEWVTIFNFVHEIDYGNWIPYKNFILSY